MAKSAVGLPPPKRLDATLVTWGGGLEFHRVHDIAFGGSEFNTSTKGYARFSPITDDAGALIPTLYAGTTFDCAHMEMVCSTSTSSMTRKGATRTSNRTPSHLRVNVKCPGRVLSGA